MLDLSLFSLIFISLMCFFAGFVDSIAGGGGLISLTSYYAIGLPPSYALGNNKFSSTFGTLFASVNYAKKKVIVWKVAITASIFALIGSAIGANIALMIDGDFFSYIMLVLLPTVTIFTFCRKKKKDNDSVVFILSAKKLVLAAIIGFSIGLYDGFFGPGTGMFLTLAFSAISMPLIDASGTTKIVNLSSNLAALITFIINGNIIYSLGIVCAVFSIGGNYLGSMFALKKKSRAIKPMLLLVIALLYAKILYDLI